MKDKKPFIITVGIVVVFIVTAMFALIKGPSLKYEEKDLLRAENDYNGRNANQRPIPGMEGFDLSKYTQEPQIRVYIAEKKTVEEMPLERYLEGVVAQEANPDWPAEALAAQAIVSRTLTVDALEKKTIKRLRNADVSSLKEELQAYNPKKVNDNVRDAVKRTRGEILLYAGSLVVSIYSSCDGQISATGEESFPTEIDHPTPYFQAVADTCYKYAPEEHKSWTLKIPASSVVKIMEFKGNPSDIVILSRGPSGRVLYFGAGDKKMHAADFRKAVGYDRLKSTLIKEMIYDGKEFIFKGEGWGNGVGLCQWGAYTYAMEGMTHAEIIKHYYPGANIEKVWE